MKNPEGETGIWLRIGVWLALDVGLDLGKKATDRFGRSNCSPQGMEFAESRNVLGRILETDTVSGAVCAQQLHAGGGNIRFQAGHIDFLPSSCRLQLLDSFGDNAGGSRVRVRRAATFAVPGTQPARS